MSEGRIMLIGGGVRSGKSAFALSLAKRLGERRLFVATAEGLDDEMRARIAAHVRERGASFATLEVPIELPAALARVVDRDVVVIDCLTIWLANMLLRGDAPDRILIQVEALADMLLHRRFHSVIVSNEVGMGVVPESALGRTFRDLVGRAHQRIARDADELYFAAMGVMLRLRPEPVSVQVTEVTP
jgi:adenosylcobinamide kinase/adenosylcobinamide-phosphate guanylyltransferase